MAVYTKEDFPRADATGTNQDLLSASQGQEQLIRVLYDSHPHHGKATYRLTADGTALNQPVSFYP